MPTVSGDALSLRIEEPRSKRALCVLFVSKSVNSILNHLCIRSCVIGRSCAKRLKNEEILSLSAKSDVILSGIVAATGATLSAVLKES